MIPYVIDPKYRKLLNSQPDIAEARAGLALLYRKLRRDGRPEMARLFYRRMVAARAAMNSYVFDKAFSNNDQGLLQ